ncbi:hypothetical protein BER92_07570 [Xanthomonas fragariae]|nr:hypothetical protein BER92_07570 [Xanthomonas fragariae]
MAERVRQLDWSKTPLGASDRWPQCLRTAVDITLGLPTPATLLWGEKHCQIYNDAYIAIAGHRHPTLLGCPVAQGWPDAHEDVVVPLIRQIHADVPALLNSYPVLLSGPDGTSSTHVFDTSFSPVRNETGAIAGILQLLKEVSDREHAQLALRQSEARFRALVTTGSQMVYRMSSDWKLMFQLDGQGTLADTGTPLDSWAKKYLLPEDHAEVFGAINAAISSKSPFNKEHRVVHSDGTVGWALSHAVPLCDADGQILEWVGVGRDVSERRKADIALRESEERLRQFGEASQDILWIRDAESLQLVYLTPAFEAIYGLSRSTAFSGDSYRDWIDLIVPEDRERATDAIRKVRNGQHMKVEYRVIRPSDGAVRWLRNTDFPIGDQHGNVVMIGGIGHDFTEARHTQLRLQTLVEGIPQLVWRAKDGGAWTWASTQWMNFTGQQACEAEGNGWLATLHPDDRATAAEAWHHATRTGALSTEFRIRCQETGDYRWFQTRAAPVRSHEGTVVEWLGTSTDVHDLRELQEHQKVLVGELQHRTRNLVAVVRSIADKTLRHSQDLSEFGDVFSDRLEALARVQGLLSKLSEHDRVHFDELIRSELEALHGNFEQISLQGPSGIRLRSSTVQVLAMALHELATNALKYGALCQVGARLDIHWSVTETKDQAPWLHIEWQESGVSMQSSESATPSGGHGRELIERAMPYQLNAKTTYALGPGGVRCTISIPVSKHRLDEASAAC